MAKQVLLVGPLPRARREGVSTAFRDLVDGLGPNEAGTVNTNWMRDVEHPGRFNVLRAFESLVVAIWVFSTAWRYRTVYLVVSTSRYGLVRDALVVLAARIWGRRVVGHLHGGGMRGFYVSSGRRVRALIRIVYSQMARVIVLGDRLRGQFRFIPVSQVVVTVANGLPADIAVDKMDRELSTPLRLLYLSNLTPSKGVADLIVAAGRLGGNTDIELHICGAFLGEVDVVRQQSGESFASKIRRLIADSGITNQIFLHGTVTGDAKLEVLRESHIFVLPTYYRWEGQPLSIIEAQACGLPVVTTDHRGISDTVVFGISAESCRKKDPESIVSAINTITATPAIYRRYSTAARENYLRRFTKEIHIENMRKYLI